ncbi:hypothetical protein ACLB1Q_18840 [Escherichia coli]
MRKRYGRYARLQRYGVAPFWIAIKISINNKNIAAKIIFTLAKKLPVACN